MNSRNTYLNFLCLNFYWKNALQLINYAINLNLNIFIFKFKRSNTLTKEAQEKLIDTEAEYDTHRQNALEREQQLRRKLQDELNKQKKA